MRKSTLYSDTIADQTNLFLFTLNPYHSYLSVSSTETTFKYTTFWPEIYKQNGKISDWNEPDTGVFRDLYIDSLTGDPDIALDTFFWQRYPTLVSFFSVQRIDIPVCFQKSKSLYSSSMSTPQLRLITMLMRHGRRAHVAKGYSEAVGLILRQLSATSTAKRELPEWRFYFSFFTDFRLARNLETQHRVYYADKPGLYALEDEYQQEHTSDHYEAKGSRWVQSILYNEILDYLPLFSFYVRKVDKLQRKHSRGKSGKYTILWKYVPKYKRFITVLRWLVRDVRFQKSRTFNQRLYRSLDTLLFDKQSHLVYKLRHFVHNFVFQNHKKTLLKTLRSVS